MRQTLPSTFQRTIARSLLRIAIIALGLSAPLLASAQTGTLTGTVTTGTGEPLRGASIRVSAEGSTREGSVARSDGRYVITDIYAGDYNVEFAATGYATVKKTVRIAPDQTSILNIRLTAVKKGKTPPAPAIEEEDEDQSWVVPLDAPARITTPPADTIEPPIASLVDEAPAPDTTRKGIDTASRPAQNEPSRKGGIPIHDSTASRTTGEIAGLVIDDAGKPVGGVRIALNDARKRSVAKDGTFAIEDLQPGEYELTLTAKGYRPETRRVTVAPRWVVSLIVRLSAGE